MAPVMSHSSSRARAEEALHLRVRRKTWEEISEALGYSSRGGARLAVRRLLSKMALAPGDERVMSSVALRELQRGLFERFDAAVKRGDDAAVTNYARELRCLVSEDAKLLGIYAPERVEVTVRQSASEIIAEAENRLLAVIDAEVVETREITQ
jgi:hypothetical protein